MTIFFIRSVSPNFGFFARSLFNLSLSGKYVPYFSFLRRKCSLRKYQSKVETTERQRALNAFFYLFHENSEFLKAQHRHINSGESKPGGRYGQSQIYIDEFHLLILGGCEGPQNSELADIWLLEMKDSGKEPRTMGLAKSNLLLVTRQVILRFPFRNGKNILISSCVGCYQYYLGRQSGVSTFGSLLDLNLI